RKTGGVPSLIAQFLAALVEHGVLRPSARHWTWDEAAIERTQIPDDAVAMMRARLSALDADARELLGRAACIGAAFDLAELELISDQPRPRLAALCFELVHLGMLGTTGMLSTTGMTGMTGSTGTGFCFAHESLQRAALDQLQPSERRTLHWTLGREQLAQTDAAESGDGLFGVVDHLNAGAPL